MSYSQSIVQRSVPAPYEPPVGGGAVGGRDLAVLLICPDCKEENPNLIESFSSGDLVCGNSGMVLGDRIVDTRSEWRTFANDDGDDPSRVGAAQNSLMDGMENLDTTIGFRDGNTGVARELQRAASKATGAKAERNLLSAFKDIQNLCDSIGLPKRISEVAKHYYKRTEEEKLLRAKSQEAIIACCIFIACRQGNVPRSFKEIYKLTNVPKKVIGQCFKIIEQAFLVPQKNGPATAEDGTLQPSAAVEAVDGLGSGGAADLISRFCDQLSLPPNFHAIAREVVHNSVKHSIAVGRSPTTIAGGAILFSCELLGQRRTSKEVGDAAGVSESTVKLVYKLFYQERDKLVNKEWLESGRADMSRLPPVEAPKIGAVSTPSSTTPTPSISTPTAPRSGTTTPTNVISRSGTPVPTSKP